MNWNAHGQHNDPNRQVPRPAQPPRQNPQQGQPHYQQFPPRPQAPQQHQATPQHWQNQPHGQTTPPKKKRKVWPWVAGGIGAIVIANVIGAGADDTSATAPSAPTQTPASGRPLVATQAPTQSGPPTAQPPSAAAETSAAPRVAETTRASVTVSQQQAKKSAEQYLKYSAFSRKGLIEQLEFEGFSTADATYAVDNVIVDWNEQAAQSAKDYLKYSSFSRKGLIEQLEFEGFTTKQAEHGVNAVGL